MLPGAGILVRFLDSPREYTPVWHAQRRFTDARGAHTPDELWILEHRPVFTLGQGADAGHIHDAGDIPVVRSDRGGQVSYHGPGQLVAYLLLDLRRRGIGPMALVALLEEAVLEVLSRYGVAVCRMPGAPGVYAQGATPAKLASLGLRVRRGCSMHGVAVNVAPDLAPFARINPCGVPGLAVSSLRQLLPPSRAPTLAQVAACLVRALEEQLAALPGARRVGITKLARPLAEAAA